MNWCCAAFEGWYGQAGERGIGILIGRDSTGTPEFILQYRAIEQRDEKLLSSQQPISPVVDVRMQYCPWCGRDLERCYGPYVDKLFRPYLRISDF
jgi:hypothetical protein